jgi:hypothetical protein
MNDLSQHAGEDPGRQQLMSALFANLVIQQTNTALVFLGQAPHPESGQVEQDLDYARILIDQLEMLEVKTKGNLNKNEEALLTDSLASLRLAFVRAVEHPAEPPVAKKEAAPSPTATSSTTPPSPSKTDAPAAPVEAAPESRKKFTKKY